MESSFPSPPNSEGEKSQRTVANRPKTPKRRGVGLTRELFRRLLLARFAGARVATSQTENYGAKSGCASGFLRCGRLRISVARRLINAFLPSTHAGTRSEREATIGRKRSKRKKSNHHLHLPSRQHHPSSIFGPLESVDDTTPLEFRWWSWLLGFSSLHAQKHMSLNFLESSDNTNS